MLAWYLWSGLSGIFVCPWVSSYDFGRCWRIFLRSVLDCKESKQVNPKGNQPWMFIGRSDVIAPILWQPDAKNWLIGKDWCWERLKASGEEDDRGLDGLMASPTWWTWVWILMMDREAWHDAIHGVAMNCPWLSNWTELMRTYMYTHSLESTLLGETSATSYTQKIPL